MNDESLTVKISTIHEGEGMNELVMLSQKVIKIFKNPLEEKFTFKLKETLETMLK